MTSIGVPLRASEMAVHRAGVPGGQVLAALEGKAAQDQAARPVVRRVARWRRTRALLRGHGRLALPRRFRRRVRAVLAGADCRRRRGGAGAPRGQCGPGVPRPGQDGDDSRASPSEPSSSRGAGPHAAARGPRAPRRRPTAPRRTHSLVANGGAGRSRGPIGGPGRRPGTISQVSTATGATVDEVVSVVARMRDIHRPRRRTADTAGRLVADGDRRRRGQHRRSRAARAALARACRAGKSSGRFGPADRGCWSSPLRVAERRVDDTAAAGESVS